jgi:TonB-linked SusC/RagA family outer membrane protein
MSITPPFVKGLSVNGSFSYDLTNYFQKAFYQPWILYTENKTPPLDPVTHLNVDNPLTPSLRGLSSPQNNETYRRTINQTTNVNVTYNKKFGDHNVALYAGYEQYASDFNELYGFRQYYISTLIQTMNAGADLDKNTTGYMTIYGRKSWIGRLTYDYKGKYLAELLFRRDGSLKYTTSGRWGNFPGLLLGWRASEEGFWKDNLPFINYFKLRGSYGKMGLDPGDPFQYMNKFGLSSGMVFGTGSAIETAVGPPTVANPIITWETQTTQNIGFDSKFLSDLFHLNFEYFYNKRENILVPRDASVPNFTGISLPDENIARVDNQGFEVDFGVHKNIAEVRLDVTANYSHNNNKVVFMDEPARTVPWQEMTGHSFSYNRENLMYRAIGIFSTQADVDAYPHWTGAKAGDVIFEDVSGDGVINGDDRVQIDYYDAPKDFYGINIDASWKNFSLNVLIQGQGKYYKFNHYDERRGEAGNYFQWTYDGRWQKEGDVTNVARAFNRNDYYWAHAITDRMSTYWIDNCAYTRLKNVVLTYNIPSSLYSKLGISRASVYFSGNNLALLYTATRKFDPEVTGAGVYPAMKTFAFGANVTF